MAPDTMDPHRRGRPSLSRKGLLLAATAGIAVLIGVPERDPSPAEAAEGRALRAVRHELSELREAVESYRLDHARLPGHPPTDGLAATASETWLRRHLTMASNERGDVVPTAGIAHPFGPYLPSGIPTNPANGLASVHVIEPGARDSDGPTGHTGWTYDPVGGEVRANTTGELAGATLYDL